MVVAIAVVAFVLIENDDYLALYTLWYQTCPLLSTGVGAHAGGQWLSSLLLPTQSLVVGGVSVGHSWWSVAWCFYSMHGCPIDDVLYEVQLLGCSAHLYICLLWSLMMSPEVDYDAAKH